MSSQEPRASRELQVPDPAGSPGDIPAGRPSALSRLDPLAGVWDVEASFAAGYLSPDSPAVSQRGGRTSFEWLEGAFFLVQRFRVENQDAPSGLAIIGLAEPPEAFTQHYYDSRGVHRVYQMAMDHGIWRLWREAPGFWQRYAGRFSGDGRTIEGAWERSPDGSQWAHDFGLTYRKISYGPHPPGPAAGGAQCSVPRSAVTRAAAALKSAEFSCPLSSAPARAVVTDCPWETSRAEHKIRSIPACAASTARCPELPKAPSAPASSASVTVTPW
jgi:hypothetical protein